MTIANTINNYMDKYTKTYAFSGNIMATKDGDVIYEKSYGHANIEHEILNNDTTKFRLWSITKQFTAAAILLLEERGFLKTDDLISKYLDGFDKRITIHQLLNHTSGIFNYSSEENSHEVFQKLDHKEDDLMSMFSKRPLESAPGDTWNYCNTGYYILGKLIEELSGETLDQFLQINIYKPLNMTNTGLDNGKELINNKATGYYLDGDDLIHCNYINMKLMYASGGMYSTASDLNIWSNALMNSEIISEESYEKMTTAYKGNYGYGLYVNKDKNRISHGGGCEGFLTELHMYKESKISIIILSNYGFTAAFDLCEVVASIIKGETVEEPLKSPKIESGLSDDFIGLYKELDFTLEVIKTESGYRLIMDGETNLLAHAVSQDTLRHNWIDEEYNFEKAEDGTISIWGVDKV